MSLLVSNSKRISDGFESQRVMLTFHPIYHWILIQVKNPFQSRLNQLTVTLNERQTEKLMNDPHWKNLWQISFLTSSNSICRRFKIAVV